MYTRVRILIKLFEYIGFHLYIASTVCDVRHIIKKTIETDIEAL